jgi:hypothetical protein
MAAAVTAVRYRRVRALRELRHAVPHATWCAAAETVRSRRLGRGASYLDVALKIDYSVTRNQSSLFSSVDSLNVGLGWWF